MIKNNRPCYCFEAYAWVVWFVSSWNGKGNAKLANHEFPGFSLFVPCKPAAWDHGEHRSTGYCSREQRRVCRPDGLLEQQEQRKLDTHKSFPLPCDKQQPWGSALCMPRRAQLPSLLAELLLLCRAVVLSLCCRYEVEAFSSCPACAPAFT